jgi:hypothetical protein
MYHAKTAKFILHRVRKELINGSLRTMRSSQRDALRALHEILIYYKSAFYTLITLLSNDTKNTIKLPGQNKNKFILLVLGCLLGLYPSPDFRGSFCTKVPCIVLPPKRMQN